MKCRICGGGSFGRVCDLGPMPLVNNLLDDHAAPCPRWPLDVVRCRRCSLAQLTHTVPPDLLFREYSYFSSQAETMVEHARGLVERWTRPGQRVVEIASNDGYLLRHAIARGSTVLGIEPARNVAAVAEAAGVPTLCAFFDEAAAVEVHDRFGPAHVIFANNVLAHVPDPNAIAAGIALLLAPDGVAHIEVPYLVRLVDAGAFDTIYHEHYSYFTVTALRALFDRHGLAVVGVDDLDLHGGSLHVRVARGGDMSACAARCDMEERLGVLDDAYYATFDDGVRRHRADLLALIDTFDTVAAYGAAAKGVVLLNACGLGTERVPWVADISPRKQGRFVPGTGQPIVPPRTLLDEKPDACLLLPWNLRAEIERQNHEYLDAGGRFIVPRPEIMLIGPGRGPRRRQRARDQSLTGGQPR